MSIFGKLQHFTVYKSTKSVSLNIYLFFSDYSNTIQKFYRASEIEHWSLRCKILFDWENPDVIMLILIWNVITKRWTWTCNIRLYKYKLGQENKLNRPVNGHTVSYSIMVILTRISQYRPFRLKRPPLSFSTAHFHPFWPFTFELIHFSHKKAIF